MQRSFMVSLCLSLAMGVTAIGDDTSSANDIRWKDLPHTDTNFPAKTYESLDEWKDRLAWLRDQVRVASGLVPEYERTPLNVIVVG